MVIFNKVPKFSCYRSHMYNTESHIIHDSMIKCMGLLSVYQTLSKYGEFMFKFCKCLLWILMVCKFVLKRIYNTTLLHTEKDRGT